ncbi:phospho-sugar mutase [Agathobaculum sp. NTUH-O15-33]|uniref:phospho-sugar mutase n=1 Tax=Agathobaculum sp. NTUH-O15-33 TaxID=3079302 RepID=UPI002958A46B|nr:phospho-sugar mutase [Agathobaculum sp. NTUH-O15-33]WNX84663.1 phospho-sugar mutase [Agathobaculum sp. NTUH-O15-33]
MDYMSEYSRWLSRPELTAEERAELTAIKDNKEEIESRFFAPLSFGTAGLRGVLGVGLYRMNRFTVGQATQGLANLVVAGGKQQMERGVAIAFDSRHFSPEFAQQSACILAASGIKTLLFDELRPTPELSFAIRHYGCIAGINITASHNPKEYNGYKVYWEDGAQLPPQEADMVAREMAATDLFTGVRTGDYDEFVKSGMIRILSKETDEAYLSEVLKVAVNPDCVKQVADEFKLVYTPFHGAGYRLVPEILQRLGYKHIICEPHQMVIDGDFPTVKSPNPENKEGFNLAIELAKENGVDLIIGTDPDADRTGIVLKDKTGEYISLSGNQVGVLLTDYIITAKKLTGTMPRHPAVLKSIVTTEMARAAAEQNGVACFETFTGFKFLAEKIKEFENTGSHEYIFAFEESYGYLCGDYARDKDAVTASMLIAEMAAYYRTQGKTLYDAMEEMYEKYGYYCEQTISITMPGVSGLQRMKELMEELRQTPLQQVGPDKVEFIRDYQPGTRTSLADGKTEPMELQGQNVLYYELSGGTIFIIRPSGTEPKVKVYIMAKGASKADAADKVAALVSAAKEIVK